MENRLQTIMFLDMQGYTKRSAKQTIEEMKLFHDQMHKFVSDIIDRWSGVMVKSLGDGFLVRFESPTNAVQAGIEIQRKLEARNAQMMNPDSLVRFRIGINTGEVGIDESGDLFGDPVNIASRIQTFADTNDVFISESTFLAMNRNDFGAVDLGSQELKNATREIRIYKVLKNGTPGQHVGAATASGSRKKYWIVAAVVVALLFLNIVGRAIKKKKASDAARAANQKQSQANSPEKGNKGSTAVDESGNARENADLLTILDIPPDDKRLKFNPDEAMAYAEIHRQRERKSYSEAEKLAAHMINIQPGPKKVPWALVLVELFFEQGKMAEGEKVCANLLKKTDDMPEAAKKRLRDQIERLRRKYKAD